MKLRQVLLAASLAVGISGLAVAATQGTVGFTSTGTLNINLAVNDEVRISNLTDINLGVFAGVDAVGTSAACVYRNGTGNYQITASGDGAASAFTLTDGVNTVPYSVQWDDGLGASAVTTGVALIGQTGADDASPTCATTGPNGTVTVTVAATDANGLPAATYAGVLTLLVAPE
ncbi:MAG: hypothetical protein KJO55_03350 [Gammaproteobacteria bacterium]|nr:hypothetical protein [Gammaproteobacteria bacterium]NND59964.1 hypothetical protein [Gammaproteobacteria bacterium]